MALDFKILTVDQLASLSPEEKDAVIRAAIDHRDRTAAHIKKLNKEAGDSRVELKAYKVALTDPETGEVPTPADLKERLKWNDPDETDPAATGADEPADGGEARKPSLDAEGGAVDSSAPASADLKVAVLSFLAKNPTTKPGQAEALLLRVCALKDGALEIDGEPLTFEDLPAELQPALGAAGSGGRAPVPARTPVPEKSSAPAWVLGRREIAPGLHVTDVDVNKGTVEGLK